MKRVIIEGEESGYSKEFMEKERARAIKEIENSDNFVVVYHAKKGGGGAISCISGDNLLPMSFALDKINREIMDLCKNMIKKGMLSKVVNDLMKGVKDEQDNNKKG